MEALFGALQKKRTLYSQTMDVKLDRSSQGNISVEQWKEMNYSSTQKL